MDSFNQTFTQGTILFFLVSALISALVVLLVHRAFPWLIGWICRPFIWVGRKAWNWIAPRNPFSIALRSYRKHILRSNLSKIENPVGPVAHVPLERAFAPLRLLAQNQRELIDLFPYVSVNK